MHSKILALFLIFFTTILTGCSNSNKLATKNGFYFDTTITITIYNGECNQTYDELINECFKKCEYYESIISKTIDTSDTSKINNSTSLVSISDTEAELINIALKYSKLSEGAFDITIAPISALWDFSNNKFSIPDSSAIENLLPYVDYSNITLSDRELTKSNKEVMIDLGGIAKGYIADKLKEYLVNEGVNSALINLGGNIHTIGGKPDSEAFNIGVQKPFVSNEYSFIINGKDISVVTSGIYERNKEINGKLYHHIINPDTGYPCDNNLFSVTIISKNSVDGDALSTACFVLGIEKGLQLINQLDDIYCIFIDSDYNLHLSDGITIDSNNKIYIK